MKRRKSVLFPLLLFLAGIAIFCYPILSEYRNKIHSSTVIGQYNIAVSDTDDDGHENIISQAIEYNKKLCGKQEYYINSEIHADNYMDILNVDDSGMMGYIEIKAIDVRLPVYHTSDSTILQGAIGHLEWSSLPVGGSSSHCVLSGHRGLPSARLFTDLNKLTVGDTFSLYILNEILTYEVDQILVVEPTDFSPLLIEDGMDYCTLLTCTPYGINSHRLLVRGRRVDDNVTDEVQKIVIPLKYYEEPTERYIAGIILGTVLFVLVVAAIVGLNRKKSKQSNGDKK